MYAAQPHVIHHTTVVQPNSIPSAIYPAPVAAPRTNGVAMGMVAGTTMAMSAGEGHVCVSVRPPPGTHERVKNSHGMRNPMLGASGSPEEGPSKCDCRDEGDFPKEGVLS